MQQVIGWLWAQAARRPAPVSLFPWDRSSRLLLCGIPPLFRYDEIAAWMEEQAKLESDTEAKTERWLELAELL